MFDWILNTPLLFLRISDILHLLHEPLAKLHENNNCLWYCTRLTPGNYFELKILFEKSSIKYEKFMPHQSIAILI